MCDREQRRLRTANVTLFLAFFYTDVYCDSTWASLVFVSSCVKRRHVMSLNFYSSRNRFAIWQWCNPLIDSHLWHSSPSTCNHCWFSLIVAVTMNQYVIDFWLVTYIRIHIQHTPSSNNDASQALSLVFATCQYCRPKVHSLWYSNPILRAASQTRTAASSSA